MEQKQQKPMGPYLGLEIIYPDINRDPKTGTIMKIKESEIFILPSGEYVKNYKEREITAFPSIKEHEQEKMIISC